MNANYTYSKLRREFGRQCSFVKSGPIVLANVTPEPGMEEQLWSPENPVDKSTNKGNDWSQHEANTVRVEYAERGIFHTEGGWPKDINLDDPEQVVRFRKKAEKDETYLQAVMQMSSLAEHYINQNNSIDIYQSYFTDPSCQKMQTLAPSFRTVAVMSDPREPTRPVQNISWSPDQGTLVAVSYADMRFQMADPDTSCDSFIFDLEDSTAPYFTIESPHPIVTLEFNHRDAQCLAGGLMSGQVAFWDIRKSSTNVAISNIRDGHRDPVRSLHWIHSKTNTEFYTGSSDGQVMWWDARKITEPTEVLILDLSKGENVDEPEWTKWARSHGVFCMDYDPSIPIRFMDRLNELTFLAIYKDVPVDSEKVLDVIISEKSRKIGTETGLVFNGNRKGKTVFEKISSTYNCHYGPVYSVQRNPAFLKNFMTVGDWQVRIWSEDVKESPIMWTKHHDVKLTDGAWSESKPSVFYTTRTDGCLDGWDILQKQKDPILTVKVADKGLNCIRCHEGGALLAVGDDCGKTYVIKMNDWFVTAGKNDKALLTAMFDRETRREKIIEAKQRELKLKTKTSAKTDNVTTKDRHAQLVETEIRMVQEAEKEFMELIDMIKTQSLNDNDNTDELENANEVEDSRNNEFNDQKINEK